MKSNFFNKKMILCQKKEQSNAPYIYIYILFSVRNGVFHFTTNYPMINSRVEIIEWLSLFLYAVYVLATIQATSTSYLPIDQFKLLHETTCFFIIYTAF